MNKVTYKKRKTVTYTYPKGTFANAKGQPFPEPTKVEVSWCWEVYFNGKFYAVV